MEIKPKERTDSCWGFYSDKWGDDLLEEIAREVTDSKLFEFLEELVA